MLKTLKNEYYHYGDKYLLIKKIKLDGVDYGVCRQGDEYDGYGYELFKMADLKKWEDTYQYKTHKEIEDKTAELKADQAKIVNEIKNKAVEALVFRLQLNNVFTKDQKMTEVGNAIVKELRTLIDKEDVTKKEPKW